MNHRGLPNEGVKARLRENRISIDHGLGREEGISRADRFVNEGGVPRETRRVAAIPIAEDGEKLAAHVPRSQKGLVR